MRTYKLFVIKKDIYNIYKDKPLSLYKTLYNLSNIEKENLQLGVTLYHQLCDVFDVNRLEKYMEDKYKLEKKNGIYSVGNNKMLIKPSRTIIKTNTNIPNIFIDFKCYNRLIFVVDFEQEDFFFLADDYNRLKK